MRKILALGCITLITGCASYDSSPAREQWNLYDTDSLSTTNLRSDEALAVFYRPSELQGPAVNVYMNGRYQASLIKEGYTPMAVCAEKALLTASFSSNQQFGNRTKGVTYALPAQEKTYIRVTTDEQGEPIFERVSEEQAHSEMPLKDKVIHTLSRTNSACQSEIVIKNTIMSAQALWDTNKFAYRDILPAGKQEIENVIAFVRQNEARITQIEVSGYADPQGNDAYNLKLSQQRAEAVRESLMQAGITQQIEAVGYGKQNLAAANCAIKYKNNPKQRTVCDAQNRRVEITVYGR